MLLLRIYFYVVYTGNRFLFPIATENGAKIVNEPDPAYSIHTRPSRPSTFARACWHSPRAAAKCAGLAFLGIEPDVASSVGKKALPHRPTARLKARV